MKHKAKTWNYCWPDDPQPGLLHLEPPALSGEATFWVQCGGGTSEEQNKIADRIAALWNMAERLGLSTEEIEGIASDTNSEATVEHFLGCPATNNLMKKYMRKQYGRTR